MSEVTEPLYDYHKGIGWVPTNPMVVKLRENVYLELRVPKPGEYYTYFSKHGDYFIDGKDLNIREFTNDHRNYRCKDFPEMTEDELTYLRSCGYINESNQEIAHRRFVVVSAVSSG